MQISSNHSGVNFSSVYKSVVTRHTKATVEQATPASAEAQPGGDNNQQSLRMHRETLQLQAAQRVAERTADVLADTPEL